MPITMSEQLRVLIDNLNKYLSALDRREGRSFALLREGRIKKPKLEETKNMNTAAMERNICKHRRRI